MTNDNDELVVHRVKMVESTKKPCKTNSNPFNTLQNILNPAEKGLAN